jgi:hypothetical protein
MVVKREVRLRASDYPASCYFRINPLFETVAARHDWINRVIDFAQYDRSSSSYRLGKYRNGAGEWRHRYRQAGRWRPTASSMGN